MTEEPPTTDDLLDAARHPLTDERPYVHVTPTETTLSPDLVTTNIADLHGLGATETGWLPWGGPSQPTIEMLLAANGPPNQRRIDYLFGIDVPTKTTALAETLRGWFPRAQVATEECRLVDALGLTDAAAASLRTQSVDEDAASTVTPLADHTLGGLEVVSVAAEAADWQAGLTPFTAFVDGDQARYPTAGIVDALRNTSVPMLFQVLVRPKPDWTAEKTARLADLAPAGNQENDASAMDRGFDEAFGRPRPDDQQAGYQQAADPAHDTRSPRDEQRRDAIQSTDATTSFTVNARAVTFGTDSDAASVALESLQPRFRKIGTPLYGLTARTYQPGSKQAAALCERVAAREFTDQQAWRRWLRERLPDLAVQSRAIVTGPDTLPNFTVIDGPTLTAGSKRALATVPTARQSMRLPEPDALEPFLDRGFFLGYPKTADGTVWDEGVAVPPNLQLLHLLIFAATGHGKTIQMLNGMRENVAITDGADVFVLPKGGGTADAYMRAHYADHGTLENVYYFDCADTLPAISFFDIQPALDAGFDRGTVAHERIQAFLDVVRMTMPDDTYERAPRSRQALYWLLAALYDPTFGGNSFSLADLEQEVRRLEQTGELPPVEDPALRARLADLQYDGGTASDAVIRGVRTRVQNVAKHDGVATLFNYQPTTTDPRFEFADVLDEDVVLLFDTGGLSDTGQEIFAVVLFAKLWRAVKQRAQAYETRVDTPPVVNLIVEEAKDVAVAEVFQTLLAQGREFRLSTLLSMQRPGQLKEASPAAYEELKTEVQTVLAGHQKASPAVAEWFATNGEIDETQDMLAGLSRGEWLTLLPQEHNRPRPLRFKVEGGDLPPGYRPEAVEEGVPEAKCFTETQEQAYQSLKDQRTAATAREYGIDNRSYLDAEPVPTHPATSADDVRIEPGGASATSPSTGEAMDAGAATSAESGDAGEPSVANPQAADVTTDGQPGAPATEAATSPDTATEQPSPSAEEDQVAQADDTGDDDTPPPSPSTAASIPDRAPSRIPSRRPADGARSDNEMVLNDNVDGDAAETTIDSPLPFTKRMPSMVELSDDERYLECRFCQSRYDRDIDGMQQAINCCRSMEEVDRDDIPVCDITVKLDTDERSEIPLTDEQLAFLQLVHDAKHFAFSELEFNPLTDSCRLLRHYAGVDREATQELQDKGLLRRETNQPHLMFSLTPRGRKLIGEPHRHGIAFGDGKGDLDETLQHTLSVELTARYLHEQYVAPADEQREVKCYHEIDDHRLDVVVLDADGDVHIAVEVERTENHDTKAAVPADYDKMAACDPAEAIWVVMTQAGGHAVLEALNNPKEGPPRLSKMYSENTPPRRFNVDAPGCTAVYTMTRLRNELVDDLSLDS